jgi:hypothetical protein
LAGFSANSLAPIGVAIIPVDNETIRPPRAPQSPARRRASMIRPNFES